MIVFLNGEFVPEERAVVSVFDRSFLYGDGLFETLRVCHGRPFRWQQHCARLERGAEFLKLRLPFGRVELTEVVGRLIAQNQMRHGLLRVTLSRGIGPRGYSTRGACQPFLVMTCFPGPMIDQPNVPRWKLITSSFRVPSQERLSTFKTCNKLPHIMARAEAEAAGADEGLLLTTNGDVAEAASSNLFWIAKAQICTTPLGNGVLAGVTREVVFEICDRLNLTHREITVRPDALLEAQGVFLSLSSLGIVGAESLDRTRLSQSPLVSEIQGSYLEMVARESAKVPA